MIVPYASNLLGFERTEGEVWWGTTGKRMEHALHGVGTTHEKRSNLEDLQNEVAEFINNNQDPEVNKRQAKTLIELEKNNVES